MKIKYKRKKLNHNQINMN